MGDLELSLTWDQSNWTRPQRRTSKAVVGMAADLAAWGLAEAGVRSLYPQKTVRVCRAVTGYGIAGETDSPTALDVNLPVKDVKHNKLHRVASRLPGIVFHEIVHTLRFEHFPIITLREKAVSEGVAYVYDDDFQAQFLFPDEYVQLTEMLPERGALDKYAKDFLRSLEASEAADLDVGDLSPEFLEVWDGVSGVHDFSPLEIIGIAAVYRAKDNGAQLRDMITTPAEDVTKLLAV